MRCISWATAVMLALSANVPSHAQILTEQQFLEDVLANHPGVAAAEADLAAAAGLRRQAGILENPELAWEREDPDSAARQDTWRLSWRLPFDGRRHRVAAGDAAVAASQAGLAATRLDIRAATRSLFASWYAAVEREAILRANLDHTRQLAAWLRARAEAGEAAGAEARRLELEVEVLDREVAAARADALAQRAAAAAWSGLVTGEIRPGRPILPAPPGTADVSGRPDLMALAHRAAQAEARHELQRRVLEPPEVSVGWLELRDSVQSFDGPVLGVAWPVPLFNRNQGYRDAAAAEAERARLELESAQRRAVEHAQAALASYSELHRAAAPAAAGTRDDAVVDSVRAAFEAGEASLTDVLDTLRTTVDVRVARLETLVSALAAERELEAAIGHPLPTGGSS